MDIQQKFAKAHAVQMIENLLRGLDFFAGIREPLIFFQARERNY